MICSYCNSYNNDNYKFCQYCGKTLVAQYDQIKAQSPYTTETLRQNPPGTHNTDQVLLGFAPLDGSPQKPLHEIQHPQNIKTPPHTQVITPSIEQREPQQTIPQIPHQYSPTIESSTQSYQPSQATPASSTVPAYQPQQLLPLQKQSLSYSKKQTNRLTLVLSIFAIVFLLIGIFAPILSFKVNPSGLLGMFMESFDFLGLSEFKNIGMTHSPISMMTGKAPKLNATQALGNTVEQYLNNELNQYYSVIKNTRNEDLDASNQLLKKTISSLQLIGAVLCLFAFLSAIFVGIKLISPNSQFSTTLVSFGSSLLLILLFGGLIFLKSIKIDLGEMGAYLGIPSFKLSEIIKISPAIGYFFLAIGSSLALIRAFNKQS